MYGNLICIQHFSLQSTARHRHPHFRVKYGANLCYLPIVTTLACGLMICIRINLNKIYRNKTRTLCNALTGVRLVASQMHRQGLRRRTLLTDY